MRTLCLVLSLASIASAQTPLMREVLGIEEHVRETRYRHATHVDVDSGVYEFDCSGMVNWALRRSEPAAFRSLGRARPVAATYARTIARAPTDRSRRGWQRIDRWRDVRPGDVFAFERPDLEGTNRWLRLLLGERPPSGHTGIIVSEMRSVAPGILEADIIDSTSFPHANDARPWGGEGGFGRGTMSFVIVDGALVGYGWLGSMGPVIWQRVWIGRPGGLRTRAP